MDNKFNVENPLVKFDQKVHSVVAMTEFKKTREDHMCNVDSPLVELGMTDHIYDNACGA